MRRAGAAATVGDVLARICLYAKQPTTPGDPLDSGLRRDIAGDRIALEIRYGIIDRNTLRGPGRFARLDRALAASDALAAEFLAGQAPDAEDQRQLADRMSALFYRRRMADVVALYEAFLARGLAVPVWARRDVAGSYLALRRPQNAVTLYREVIAANSAGQSAAWVCARRHPRPVVVAGTAAGAKALARLQSAGERR